MISDQSSDSVSHRLEGIEAVQSSHPEDVSDVSQKEADEISQTAQKAISDTIKHPSKGHVWNTECLKLDRNKLQKNLIHHSHQTEISFLHQFFCFFQNLIFKINLVFGLIQEKPPEDVNFTILAKIVRAVPDQQSCSSSILLSYTHEYVRLQNQNKQAKGEKTSDDQKLEDSLKSAAAWSKEIEKFQKSTQLRANSKKLRAFIENLKAEVARLEIGDKRLIPGSCQQEGGQSSDALYEVEKTGSDTFTVKVLSLNEEHKDYWKGEKNLEKNKIRYNPILEFREVSTQQLQDSLEPLIHIQLPQMFQSKKSENRGFFGERLHAIHRLIAAHDTSDVKIQLTPLGIMGTIYGKFPQPSEQNLLVKVPPSAKFPKILMTYIKLINPQNYNAMKLELELSALFACVNEDTYAIMHNQGFRDLVYISSRKLIYELEKNKDKIGLDEEHYQDIMCDLKDLLVMTQKLNQQAGKLGIPPVKLSPLEQTFKLHSPTLPDKLSTPQEAKKKVQVASFKDLQIPTLNPETGAIDAEDARKSLEVVKGQIQTIKDLYKKEDYATMEALILDLARQLPPPTAQLTKNDFWKALYELDPDPNKTVALETMKEWNDSNF